MSFSFKNNFSKHFKIIFFFFYRSYHDSIKYTYPTGRLEPGKLLGRMLSWCGDPDAALRSHIVDCVGLSLSICIRHRSTSPEGSIQDALDDLKVTVEQQESKVFHQGIRVSK